VPGQCSAASAARPVDAGLAYNVASVNTYRSDGVDLETCSATGQWFRYTVNVASAGTYTVSLRLP
jgi:hypothetical protein